MSYRRGFTDDRNNDDRIKALVRRTGKTHLYLWALPRSRYDAIVPEWLYVQPAGQPQPHSAVWDWLDMMDDAWRKTHGYA